MSHPKNPDAEGKPDFRPEAQQDESHGSVKGEQLTDRTMRGNDLPRGAERGAGRGGAGGQDPGGAKGN